LQENKYNGIIILEVKTLTIKNTKIRTPITFPKDLKKILMEQAQEEGRSFNSLIIEILHDYVNKDNHK